jgi:hypothetical protein
MTQGGICRQVPSGARGAGGFNDLECGQHGLRGNTQQKGGARSSESAEDMNMPSIWEEISPKTR